MAGKVCVNANKILSGAYSTQIDRKVGNLEDMEKTLIIIIYPKAMERSTILNGKINYFYYMAIFNSYVKFQKVWLFLWHRDSVGLS